MVGGRPHDKEHRPRHTASQPSAQVSAWDVLFVLAGQYVSLGGSSVLLLLLLLLSMLIRPNCATAARERQNLNSGWQLERKGNQAQCRAVHAAFLSPVCALPLSSWGRCEIGQAPWS